MKMNAGTAKLRVILEHQGRFDVEGKAYSGPECFGVLKAKGWEGTYSGMVERLRRGCRTWDKLLVAPKPIGGRDWKREKQEMADIIAAYDARKKAITQTDQGD